MRMICGFFQGFSFVPLTVTISARTDQSKVTFSRGCSTGEHISLVKTRRNRVENFIPPTRIEETRVQLHVYRSVRVTRAYILIQIEIEVNS